MLSTKIRKRQLEEKLGLSEGGLIKSNFTSDITATVWDILNGRYNIFTHPNLKDEEEMDFVFCLIIRNIHASIWAVQDCDLSNVSTLVSKEYVSPCVIEEFLEIPNCVRRYHVVFDENSDRYLVQVDPINVTCVEYDVCLYIGTITLSKKTLDVIMAVIADKTYLLLQSDCLDYCKSFVYIYFELIEEEMNSDQKTILEKLTVTTNVVSQISERSGRQKPTKGFSIRSLLYSPFVHGVLGVCIGNFLWWTITKVFKLK